MDNKTYYTLCSVIFFTIALGHVLRLVNEWEAVVGGVDVPLWASWIAVAIAGYLGVRGWQLANKRHR